MDERNIRRFERATRVQTFGRDNAAEIGAGSKAAGLLLEPDFVVLELNAANVGQRRTPVGKPARTARAIDLDEPGFAAFYRLPAAPTASNIKTHADALLARLEDAPADTPARLAEKAALRAKFIGKFIPADFVEDLRADRDAIDGKKLANTADNLEGLESTESIEVLLLQGGQEVTRLDAMMQNLYRSNPAKLHAWLAASRVERSPKRKKDEGNAADGTTPTAPQP